MPALNWDVFARLPGSPERNFEQVCRGIALQNFGSYGVFRSLANQPGVEFHLKVLRKNSTLGDLGRWWGWQCKWYQISSSGNLKTKQRRDIEDGIRKAEAHVPGLTDWVLWTRRTLSKSDQKWFDGLSSTMTLHLWTADEIDNLLTGDAEVLRSTYFGELVLTPEILRGIHEQSIAPILSRWQPEVHHVGAAERELRRMLGESESWDVLQSLSSELRVTARAMENAPRVPTQLEHFVNDVVSTASQCADILDNVALSIRAGDYDKLLNQLVNTLHDFPVQVATAPRKLRAGNHLVGLYATNALALCFDAILVLDEVKLSLSNRVVAVLAPAGCGKTQLAAQLTTETSTRPHGVFLRGYQLQDTHTLDDLAQNVSIAAKPVQSMEALLAAVNAAGQRAGQRLPVCIDGLNESEDPRKWKPLLASLETVLRRYPHVLLVCTLRPEFVSDSLPEETYRVEIRGYEEETIEAIREHFHYYKIDPTDAQIPLELLSHPLTLRLLCEVTNPTRQEVLGVNAMPASMTALFDRYLMQVATRVVELAPRAHRFCLEDVKVAISRFAAELWSSRSRAIKKDALRNLLDGSRRQWDQSLVFALEHEGVILRMPSNGYDEYVPVYDLLGGHIIADTLLASRDNHSFEEWINEPNSISLLAGSYDVRHPFAEDIFMSLVGQIPGRYPKTQLWQILVDEPLRRRALRLAANLEESNLDTPTVEALLTLVVEGDSEILDRLWQVRGRIEHPLNADALTGALQSMTVANRDLRWTEWLRRNSDEHLQDLTHLESRWRKGQLSASDELRAQWVMWTLTSTVRRLRDQATRTLYWFGRSNPEVLFSLTIKTLSMNDAYVGERMLAASYGVVMSHQVADTQFGKVLEQFLNGLAQSLVGEVANAPTHHYLARSYVRGIVATATRFYEEWLPSAFRGQWSFAIPERLPSYASGSPEAEEVGGTLHMDFDNYTLGRLFDDRRSYDSKHVGHQQALSYVRGVIWALGWRMASFEALDRSIMEGQYRDSGRHNRPYSERYGKKYGLVGYYLYAGILEEEGQLSIGGDGFLAVDIDPSFPEAPAACMSSLSSSDWLRPSLSSDKKWLLKHSLRVPREVLIKDELMGHAGTWVAVFGDLKAKDHIVGRTAIVSIAALVTSVEDESHLLTELEGGWKPMLSHEAPTDYYTYAGEIPWHHNFALEAMIENGYCEQMPTGESELEILAHNYSWEGSRSELNDSFRAVVPSKVFSEFFKLVCIPQSFDHLLPDGTKASITIRGIGELEGCVLYLRKDLLQRYVGDRTIVWFLHGERSLVNVSPDWPDWYIEMFQNRTNSWSQVIHSDDLLDNVPDS